MVTRMHSFSLSGQDFSIVRGQCFKRRSKTLLDAYVAGSILVQFSAETPHGYVF